MPSEWIPFDSVSLAAVVEDLRHWQGAQCQRVVQPADDRIVMRFFQGQERGLLLAWGAESARAHRAEERYPAALKTAFLGELQRRLLHAQLVDVRQRGRDRVLDLDFVGEHGAHRLTAELMGKHANLILVNGDGIVVAAAKWVGARQSKRTVLPNQPYAPPPFGPRPPLNAMGPGDDPREYEGVSPFLRRWLEAAGPDGYAQLQEALRTGQWHPVRAQGRGAYPLPLSPLGVDARTVPDLGLALEAEWAVREARADLVRQRQALLTQLNRVRLAREVALAELDQALDAAARASELQARGNLVLAYQAMIPPSASSVDVWDDQGEPVTIELNPELSAVENAERWFARARKAKDGVTAVAEQHERIAEDLDELRRTLQHIELADSLDELAPLQRVSETRRWLFAPAAPVRDPKHRPYEGHAVREVLGPLGWRVLYGENATANDYLTLRVARPSDLWLHVRGGPSAHVIIPTHNQPDRVPPEVVRFAAELAVRHSPSKHSTWVSVDITQRRYVRRPKGAAPGMAVYSHERTVHVELAQR